MTNSKRILIVDDDPDDQSLLTEAVNQCYPSVLCKSVSNGAEALEHIHASDPYDMVFLDLNMPKLNGFDTLARLRENNDYKKTPVIIISTSRNICEEEQCLLSGADGYIQKPSTMDHLRKIIMNVFVNHIPNRSI